MISADRAIAAAEPPPGAGLEATLGSLQLDRPGRRRLSGAPEGFDGRILATLAGGRDLLHVCLDDLRMARLVEDLAFFDPALSGRHHSRLGLPALRPRLAPSRYRGPAHRWAEPAARPLRPQRGWWSRPSPAFCSACRPKSSFETAVLELVQGSDPGAEQGNGVSLGQRLCPQRQCRRSGRIRAARRDHRSVPAGLGSAPAGRFLRRRDRDRSANSIP